MIVVPLPRDDQSEHFTLVHDSAFLELHDEELSAVQPISLKGTCSLVDGWIIITAHIQATLHAICSMCADDTDIVIDLPHWEHTEEFSTQNTLDITEAVREAILLEAPFFPLCGGSVCRNIDKIRTFIRSEDETEETHTPFRDLL